MAKVGRWGLWALLGVGLLGVAAMLLLESPWARHWLEGQASQRLNGRAVEIGDLDIQWGWPLTVRLEDIRVANLDWARHEQMLRLAALSISVNTHELLKGRVDLEAVSLERPEVHLARREDGTTNWADLIGERDESTDAGGNADLRPERIRVDRGQLTYHEPAQGTDLSVDFRTRDADGGARGLVVEARGEVRGEPLQARGQGGSPAGLVASDGQSYPLTLSASVGRAQASFDGRLAESDGPHILGQFRVSVPDDADVASLVGKPELDLPAVEFEGRLNYAPSRWALEEVAGRLGDSRVGGSLAYLPGARPRIEAQLHADRLSLERWGITQLDSADEQRDAKREIEQAVGKTVEDIAWDRRWAQRLAPLRGLDAELDVAVERLSYGDTVVSDVAVAGRLEAGRLDLERLHVAQGDSELTSQGWLEVQADTLSGDIDTRVTSLDLGEALAPLGYPDLGMLAGRLRVRLTDATLAFDDTALDYRAPAQSLSVQLNAETAAVEGDSVPGVHLQGRGAYRDEPFTYDLTVGPLLDLKNPDQPYPVQGVITAGETRLQVNGRIEQPLQIASVDGSVALSGPNPAQLNRLTGLNLPALPPYELRGELHVKEDRVRVNGMQGRVGDSDLGGDLRLRLAERNMLWATLHSRRLDLDDLAPLTGAAPDTEPGEAASAQQRQVAQAEAANPGVFPDREWNLEGLRRMDAEVHYDAASVSAKDVPLNDVALDLRIERGVLTLTPLRFGLGGGEVEARVTMDARGDALQGDLELSLSQVNLKPLLERADLPRIAEDSAGVIGGQGQMRFQGKSLDESMAHLDGVLELAMSGGVLDALVLEAAGLDVSEALLAALADSDQVPMTCAYLRLDATDGTAALEQFFIDTEDSNVTGAGAIDLDAERLELVFEAHAKDPSLFASDSPVKLQGPLSDLGVNVVSRELVARGVLSVLGALVAPPLAILPWIETGTGERVGPGCRQAVEGVPDAAQG